MPGLANMSEGISGKIKGLKWSHDKVEMSNSTVLIFDEMVLKIEKISGSSKHEVKLLNWLADKLPFPKIIKTELQDG